MDLQFEQYWKKYSDNELSHSETHYLLSIYSLLKKNPELRGVTLAKELGISRSAVHLQLKKLLEKKLIKVKTSLITLPKKSVGIIEKTANKRKTMIGFLTEVLGLPKSVATKDSCKVEHLLSDKTGDALLGFLQFIQSDRRVVSQFLKEFKENQQEKENEH